MHMQEGQQEEARHKLCAGSSILSRVAAGVAMAALVLHVVSVSSSYWMEGKIREGSPIAHTGLWKDCVLYNMFTTRETWVCASYEVAHHIDSIPAFFKWTQFFAILGICGHVTTCILLLLVIMLPKMSKQRLGIIVSIASSVIGGVSVLIAMSVFPASYPHQPLPPFLVTWSVSWCFGLDLLSMVASFAVAVTLVWDLRKGVSIYSNSAA
ncbi:uncharacterized protein [Littorina saxatilis]|uniref:uncharacterized protein n=1 Tax=Littorina saxatilis TaxID=31220 RepID=UPI0038B49012